GRFDDEVDTERGPINFRRILFFEDLDALAVDLNVAFAVCNFRLQVAENRVVFQKMCQGFGVGNIVYGDDVDVPVAGRYAEEIPPDSPKTIDANFDCHYRAAPCLGSMSLRQ